ncbi:mitogen-activated protein kinase kinase kinase NPK1-like isoform X3 [Actinidia eriantha]|uniref:mitogen-activated protein kinase kinase kinase NPK1-like isoform X3 n=1 Tax=Actinidia eriantha TaxID=165200 RepID=UPI002583841F|nr:mitogen-activated protein kinase kinase kinase NPK1-like isoform X3 [Actinidia eriantha]
MQDIIGSVRRSRVFKPSDGDNGGGFGGFVEKIGSSIRKSRIGLFSNPSIRSLPPISKADSTKTKKEDGPPIRWRKGELIGCGAFGRVYMGMNLDSGELLAVKQVSIAVTSASKDKTQAHIRELEEEVKLLKNLSHPNIVRYLGTAREEESLNILLEFVPGGSISSLLGKFGSFPESVIRMYTKQLLLGLEYLHKNGIMHRDIKGANILVDNKGCIKLADFGASKKVVELVTITGAKSMKGTPYWMAPEVILQTGHSFSADIWSVGCTVIEMATGKPPWSQQYQEVAALFHIGTTKSHPPIPEHLSNEAKDFLLKCLQKEPNLRSAASDLLQHPFVTGQYQETNPTLRVSVMYQENPGKRKATPEMELKNSMESRIRTKYMPLKDVRNSVRCSTIYPEKFSGRGPLWGSSNCDDDMCQIGDKDDLVVGASMTFDSALFSDDLSKSFNPMSEPNDDWPCKFDESPELEKSRINFSGQIINNAANMPETSCNGDKDFTFPSGPSVAEDDDEVTETKIKAFLDEKALDLKKLQTPLYEEFYNSLNASGSPSPFGIENKENMVNNLNLPPKSRSPKRLPSRRLSAAVDVANTASCGTHSQRVSNIGTVLNQTPQEVMPSEPSEWKEVLLDAPQELISPSASFSDRQRKWEEELYEELERKREMMRQAGVVKTSSLKDRIVNLQKDRSRFAFLGK